jgi:hypothetical protein
MRRYPDGLDDPAITLAAIRLDLHQCVKRPSSLSEAHALLLRPLRPGDGCAVGVGWSDANGEG